MRRSTGIRRGLAAAALAVAAAWSVGAGCTDDDNNPAAPGGTAGATNRGGAGGTAATTAASSGTGGSAAAPLDDGQSAALLIQANTGEIQAAEVALSRSGSDNAAIRRFAMRMVDDHTAANTKLQAVLQSANLSAQDSSQRQALATQGAQTVNTLWATPAASFNAVYAQAQVAIHQMMMQLLQNQLIPGAQDAALKSELASELATAMTHLTDARQLAAMFPSATPITTDGGMTMGTGTGPGRYTTGH